MDRNVQILARYLPGDAPQIIAKWINLYKVEFKISKSRSTKLGDYRPPHGGKIHRISINHNLNPYSFLITAIHEFAHLTCWNRYQFRVKPHGEEWKNEYRNLMEPWFELDIFPEAIQRSLLDYMDNPAASSCTDLKLMRILTTYDKTREDAFLVESLPLGTHFKYKDGRIFIKGEKIRKRYKCMEVSSERIYLFNPLTTVTV